MNYKNREQYKHLMRVLAVAAIVLLECAVFSVFWDRYYASHLWLEPFWDKGNQIIVVIYGIFLLVFMYIYGGMKIGYMKGSSIIYSQMMTAFCANALMYLQIILLWRHLPYILPMVGMTLVDFALAGIVSWLFEKTFARLFPPREVLLIYGEYPMESLELKMNQRPDKYIVAHKVSVEVGEKELCRQIDAYGQWKRHPCTSDWIFQPAILFSHRTDPHRGILPGGASPAHSRGPSVSGHAPESVLQTVLLPGRS